MSISATPTSPIPFRASNETKPDVIKFGVSATVLSKIRLPAVRLKSPLAVSIRETQISPPAEYTIDPATPTAAAPSLIKIEPLSAPNAIVPEPAVTTLANCAISVAAKIEIDPPPASTATRSLSNPSRNVIAPVSLTSRIFPPVVVKSLTRPASPTIATVLSRKTRSTETAETVSTATSPKFDKSIPPFAAAAKFRTSISSAFPAPIPPKADNRKLPAAISRFASPPSMIAPVPETTETPPVPASIPVTIAFP